MTLTEPVQLAIVGGIVTVLTTLLSLIFLQLSKANKVAEKIHVAVNSTASAQSNKIDALTASLVNAGVRVPVMPPRTNGGGAPPENPMGEPSQDPHGR